MTGSSSGKADSVSQHGKYEDKIINNRRKEYVDICDLGGSSSDEKEVTKGIHNTEESSKEIQHREPIEVEKSGSGLNLSRKARLCEKSKRYFERKATMERNNQVSSKAHKSKTKHKENIHEDGGEYRNTQEDETVASPCDSDIEEDMLLKEMLSTWVAADYRNMFTEEDDGSWTNFDEDGKNIQTPGIIGGKSNTKQCKEGKKGEKQKSILKANMKTQVNTTRVKR